MMVDRQGVVLEEFQPRHEEGLLRLYETVFGESMLASWRYYYKPWFGSRLEHRRPVIVVARREADVVGAVCIAATTVSCHGNLVRGGLVKDVMVHPDYRGQGIFTEASRLSYEVARADGIEFLMSFPNAKSYPMFDKYLDWHTLTAVDVLEYTADGSGGNAACDVMSAAEAGRLPRIVPVVAPIQTYRDEAFYRRRFCDHWNRDNYLFVVTNDGMLVLKRFTAETAHILDVFTYGGEVDSLVTAAVRYLGASGTRRVTAFCPSARERLLSLGFRESKGSTHFVVKPLSGRCARDYRDLTRYYITWSDSDVY